MLVMNYHGCGISDALLAVNATVLLMILEKALSARHEYLLLVFFAAVPAQDGGYERRRKVFFQVQQWCWLKANEAGGDVRVTAERAVHGQRLVAYLALFPSGDRALDGSGGQQ
jgi:hypothetical protein